MVHLVMLSLRSILKIGRKDGSQDRYLPWSCHKIERKKKLRNSGQKKKKKETQGRQSTSIGDGTCFRSQLVLLERQLGFDLRTISAQRLGLPGTVLPNM